MAARPRILIAAPAAVCRKLESALAGEAAVVCAEEFDAAMELLRAGDVDLLVLCYVFDDVRPYRLLNQMQEQSFAEIPTVLVRALPVPLRDSEKDLEEAYQQLGVRWFFNLSDAARSEGPQALERFAHDVLSLVSQTTSARRDRTGTQR